MSHHGQFTLVLRSSSILFRIVQIGNPNDPQNDQIGFAHRATPPSIVGPIVGGVVGGIGGIALISLAVFFWIQRRDRQKLKDILDSEDRAGNVGRFVENKDVDPFPFTAQPAVDVPQTSSNGLSFAAGSFLSATPRPVSEVSQSPNVDGPLLPPSYDQSYLPGPSNPSQQ